MGKSLAKRIPCQNNTQLNRYGPREGAVFDARGWIVCGGLGSALAGVAGAGPQMAPKIGGMLHHFAAFLAFSRVFFGNYFFRAFSKIL
jgi:hypothetical protein